MQNPDEDRMPDPLDFVPGQKTESMSTATNNSLLAAPANSKTKYPRLLILLWPLISVVTLYIASVLSYPAKKGLTFTDNLDGNFWILFFHTVIGHLIAFSIVPLMLVIRRKHLNPMWLLIMGITGAFTAYIQISLRHLVDGLGRLDCADNCVDTVVPSHPGSVLNLSVTYMLIFLLVLSLLTAYVHRDKTI